MRRITYLLDYRHAATPALVIAAALACAAPRPIAVAGATPECRPETLLVYPKPTPRPLATFAWRVTDTPGRIEGVVFMLPYGNGAPEPLPAARVAIEGTPHQVVADSLGRFALDSIPAGLWRLRIRRIAVEPWSDTIRVSAAAGLAVEVGVRQAVIEEGWPTRRITRCPTAGASEPPAPAAP